VHAWRQRRGERHTDAVRVRLDKRLATGGAENAEILFLAANSYLALGDTTRAVSLYEQVLQRDPGFIDAYARLGALYVEQGRLEEAKQKYQQASLRKESAVAATTLIGIVLELQHKPAEARQQYERALAADPRAAVAANNLAWMLADKGENLDTALQLAQTAKAVLPENAKVANTLGFVYYKKGLFPQAVTAFKESVDRSPADASKRYYLGLAYIKSNQPEEARRALEEALKLNPQFAQAADARQALAGIKS